MSAKWVGKLVKVDLEPNSSASVTNSKGQQNSILGAIRRSSCLFTKVVIDNICCQALIDSGSATCVISSDIAKKLGVNLAHLEKVPHTLSAANGSSINVHGKLFVDFDLDNQMFSYEFLVADLHGIDLIFGEDFLEDFDVNIKFGKAYMLIGKHKIKLMRQENNRLARIRLENTVTIPAESEITTTAKLDGLFLDHAGVLEPYKIVHKKGLLMARAVVDSKQTYIPVSLVNLTDKNIKLGRNLSIANIQHISAITVATTDDLEVSNITLKHASPTSNKVELNSLDSSKDAATQLLTEEISDMTLPGTLQPLFDGCTETLNQTQQNQVKSLLLKYKDIFVDESGQVGQTNIVEHTIDIGNAKSVKIPPRRVPLAQRQMVETEIQKMLDQNIIEPSSSPWASPIVLVKKQDNSIRFCVDYRKLNSVTIKDAYPLPKIGEALDTLAGAKYFCTLDLASGYWQVKMADKHKHLTAFNSHIGLYQFKVMSFGLCNASQTFERLIELVLRGMQWKQCLCYIDDIIVFGETFDSTLENLKEVFERFRNANLKMKPKKCHLFKEQVKYLGHVVSEKGISCDPSKIEAIKHWPTPQNKTEVKSLLGLLSYYRRYIPDFARISFPLSQLTQKAKKFNWDEDCEQSFDQIKGLLTSPPVLAYPNREGLFILDTDGCQTGIGAVLSQVQNGEERVIAYASKSLNKAQQRYCTTFIELLAVITFVRHFRHYLWGRHFLVRTDHASLIWLKNFKDPEGMLARWLAILDTYDFEIQYRKGKLHSNADSLSRIPVRRRKCKREDCFDCNNPPAGSNDGKGYTLPLLACTACVDGSNKVLSSIDIGDENERSVENNAGEDDSSFSGLLSNWIGGWSHDQLVELQTNDFVIGTILRLKKNPQLNLPDIKSINIILK